MRVLGIKISSVIFRIAVRILQLFSVDACRVAPEKQAAINNHHWIAEPHHVFMEAPEGKMRHGNPRGEGKNKEVERGLVDVYV